MWVRSLFTAFLLLTLGGFATGFSRARPQDFVSLYCGDYRPQLMSWVKEGTPHGPHPRTGRKLAAYLAPQIPVSNVWPTERLQITQAWLDELEGLAGAAKLRAALSRVAMEWVVMHGSMEHRKLTEFTRSLSRVADLNEQMAKEWCSAPKKIEILRKPQQ